MHTPFLTYTCTYDTRSLLKVIVDVVNTIKIIFFASSISLLIIMSAFVAYCDKYYYELSDKSKLRQVGVNELVNDIRNRSKMTDKEIFDKSAMYEILLFDRSWPLSEKIIQTNTRFVNRLYIDIEKLPLTGSKDMVNNIANDLIAYIKENLKLYKFDVNNDEVNIDTYTKESFDNVKTDYVITHNSSSSSHCGDSYHVIFPYVYIYHVEQVKSFMNDFINKHQKYIDYVDLSVYSTRRLFRLPFSKNVTTHHKNKAINQNDIHKTEFKQDNITDYIIQYVQPNGHIIVIDRNDPINFVCRVKQQRVSGTLSKQIINIIDNITTPTTETTTEQTKETTTEQTKETTTEQTNEAIAKELNDINAQIKQLMERQQKLTELLIQQQNK